MSLTGSIIIYIIIWWIVFFSFLPVGIIQSNKKFEENIRGEDPGAPKNPNIGRKFFYTTLITSLIFMIIYYIVINNYFNLRDYLN